MHFHLSTSGRAGKKCRTVFRNKYSIFLPGKKLVNFSPAQWTRLTRDLASHWAELNQKSKLQLTRSKQNLRALSAPNLFQGHAGIELFFEPLILQDRHIFVASI